MNRRMILTLAAVIVVASLVLALAYWMAGPAGVLFGVFVLLAAGIQFMAHLGWFNLPPVARRLSNWVIIVGIVSILAIWGANAVLRQMAEWDNEPTARQERGEQQRVQEFQISAGEERPTVMVGPGTHHNIWASKPWKAVSTQNGKRKEWNRPAGWSGWDGGAPEGPLVVIGKEDMVIKFERTK